MKRGVYITDEIRAEATSTSYSLYCQYRGFDCNTENMPTKLEEGMMVLREAFHSYASKEGDPKTLNKKELKTLIETEFPSFISDCKDQASLDECMSDLDFNGDGQVDFNEFMMVLATVTLVCQFMAEEMGEN
ncbi:protein S100-A1-like isoform X2 [Thunnus maccoyii]|uniref:protein S100-A1-like isoform X2 n=1 Tax=Thunnus maccoyii TaxID=8240 RepID=UPI001C4AE3A6|nr:protein S100-A1-like isoform X2 [Thunnus maccoyii]